MAKVQILIDGQELQGAPGDRLLDLTDDAPGHLLPTHCRAAHCGTCLVAVLAGEEGLSPPGEEEALYLQEQGFHSGIRLGCQVYLAPDSSGVALRLRWLGAGQGPGPSKPF